MSDQPSAIPESPTEPPPSASGARITSGELLFRQVHPSFVETNGNPTSQAFRPTSKDLDHMLSVDLESKSSAEKAFTHFKSSTGLESAGTWAVNTHECAEVKRATWPTPKAGNDSHASVDFRDVPDKKAQTISKVLKKKAIERGRRHPPAQALATATSAPTAHTTDQVPAPQATEHGRTIDLE